MKGKQKYVGKRDFCGVFGGNPDIFKDFLPFVTADFFSVSSGVAFLLVKLLCLIFSFLLYAGMVILVGWSVSAKGRKLNRPVALYNTK